MYQIYEDEKHHLGLISEDGTHKTPAVYDEIQIKEGDYWLCRAYHNWDYFYPMTGEFSVKRREGTVKGTNCKVVTNTGGPTSLEDRDVYDSIGPRVEDGYIYIYHHGKFGINKLDGTTILKPEYDDLYVWRNANVIQVRIADDHLYFNDKGERVLTDSPTYTEEGTPYFSGLGWKGVQIREIVDEVADNHTYESKAGYVRIFHEKPKTVADALVKNCERIPMKTQSIDLLTDRWSYEFGINVVRIMSDGMGNISEDVWMKGIESLEMLGSFHNSWHFIDKFMTNSKTLISLKSLYWLKHKYDMEYDVLGDLCFAYGIDDSLADGEIKWIHLEHYNEHCFPEDYGVSDVAEYGTLEELKGLIEAHDWDAQGDPYGGAFFGFGNVRYAGRSWEETERVLEYMYDLGLNPQDLLVMIVYGLDRIYYYDDVEAEVEHFEKCAEWALQRCSFPNRFNYKGKTYYDILLGVNLDDQSDDIKNRVMMLCEKFVASGALTGEQLCAMEFKRINDLSDQYDYSIAIV